MKQFISFVVPVIFLLSSCSPIQPVVAKTAFPNSLPQPTTTETRSPISKPTITPEPTNPPVITGVVTSADESVKQDFLNKEPNHDSQATIPWAIEVTSGTSSYKFNLMKTSEGIYFENGDNWQLLEQKSITIENNGFSVFVNSSGESILWRVRRIFTIFYFAPPAEMEKEIPGYSRAKGEGISIQIPESLAQTIFDAQGSDIGKMPTTAAKIPDTVDHSQVYTGKLPPTEAEWVGEESPHDWESLTQAQMAEIYLKSASTKLFSCCARQELHFGEVKSTESGPGQYIEVYGVVVDNPTDGRDIKITIPIIDLNGNEVLTTQVVRTRNFPFLIKNDQGLYQMVEMIYSKDYNGSIRDFGKDGVKPINGGPCTIIPSVEWDQFLQPNNRVDAEFVVFTKLTDDFVPDMRKGDRFNNLIRAWAVSEIANKEGELNNIVITKKENQISFGRIKSSKNIFHIGIFAGYGIRIQPGQLQGICR